MISSVQEDFSLIPGSLISMRASLRCISLHWIRSCGEAASELGGSIEFPVAAQMSERVPVSVLVA
jgi:hypothetical protein